MSTLRRRLAGLVALLGILAIVVGLPVVLLAVGANPFAGLDPSVDGVVDALTSPDDGSLFLALIKLIGWVSWAVLTVSVLLELGSQLRGVHAPRLPGLRLPQNAARSLVGTAMLLFVAVPGLATSANAATAAEPAPPIEIVAVVSAPAEATPAPAAAAVDVAPPAATPAPPAATPAPAPVQATPETTIVEHIVQPGESLWSIAVDLLGDGHRFGEIVEQNQAVLGGQASLIRPGWVLQVTVPTPAPAAAQAAADASVVVERGDTLSGIAQAELGDAQRYPEIYEASKDIAQPGGAHLTDPNVIDVGWTLQLPTDTPAVATSAAPVETPAQAPADTAPAQPPAAEAPADADAGTVPDAAPAPQPAPAAEPAPVEKTAPTTSTPAPDTAESTSTDTADHLEEDSAWTTRTTFGVGAVLAAGVLALIEARRRTQQRRRRPGQALPMATGDAATTEQELRATADALSVEHVDVALRTLAATCAHTGQPLPVTRAARLTATQFDLYLSEPATLPTPWTGTPDELVWTLTVEDCKTLAAVDDGRATPAPYPALVTLGHDEENGHVLLNLEHLGSLAITGDDPTTREILGALAVELATSIWADDLQVTLVGAFPDLEDALQTGRIRYVPSVSRVLDDLLARAEQDRQILAASGVADLYSARVTGHAYDAWAPEIVVIASDLTDRQRHQLTELVDEMPHVAMAAITNGHGAGEWSLDLLPGATDGEASLAPIGLRVWAQQLPTAQYGHLLEVVAMADVAELDDTQIATFVPTVTEVESIAPDDRPSDPVSSIPEAILELLADPDVDAAAGDDHDGVDDHAERDVDERDVDERDVDERDVDERDDEHDETTTDVVKTDVAASAQDDASTEEPAHAATEPEISAPEVTGPPQILVLGPVDITGTTGRVEPSKRARLLEYATYLALNAGVSHTAIDDAIWPDRKTEDNLNTRNTATTKLRRWVGTNPEGRDYLPRHQAGGGYAFLPEVTTDVDAWDDLLHNAPASASTEDLEAALKLVRGIPFEGTHRKRYAWAEPVKQRLISEIVDASSELARRRLLEGRWRAAEQAVVVGLRIEPAQENLWRLRILAAHESRNQAAEAEAIDRLLTITEQLECDLEPETEHLLAALKNPGADFDRLMADAL
ncbi:LysM peptidoglycan-binding domain-containing protein [Cellulosimicrobium cellulans]|uniref:LysM peptidoglycan-binding domain-containing protein n=1 Tax=Cellulosimicrobium cellulans TaxID=1710 RepID=UPI0009D9F344|nr:LysM peptidoglycan-binding domain-containing protein [Cellulosimicrobium cellulans]